MSAFRTLAVLGVSLGLGLSMAFGCSTNAIGVEDCRDIEFARCEAGHACGFVQDVEDCKRFYRDHCLHGLRLEDEPSAAAVQSCVRSLTAVAACGPETALAACPGVTTSASVLPLACDTVRAPEDIAECGFLVPSAPPVVPVLDSGSDAASSSDATID